MAEHNNAKQVYQIGLAPILSIGRKVVSKEAIKYIQSFLNQDNI